jgi:uncharacterized protein YecT (DUF1311 family)
MSMPSTIFAGLLAIAVIAPLGAANADDECEKVGADQAAINACYNKAYKKSDAELNKLYKEIKARLKNDPKATKLLVTAQRAWIAFRDAECGFQSSGVAGGSAGPMIYSLCLNHLTKDRIGDFTSYLHCEEGNLSCPVPPTPGRGPAD